jgi:uncharacterized membrane protein
LSAIFPFICLGAVIRVLEDSGLFDTSFFTITPGIYLLVFIITIISLFASVKITKKYHELLFSIGFLILIPPLLFLRIANFNAFLMIIGLTIVACLPFILSYYKKYIKDKLILASIMAHMFDASATVVGVTFFSYYEKHVLPTFLIDAIGSAWIMFPLKLIVILPVLYLIDKYSDSKNLANFLKIVVFILGFAPGLRDLLRISMGV